jgi:probable F420-dependent oxidoreductase
MADKQRKYWAMVVPTAAPIIEMMAKHAESNGYEGLFAPQVWGPPFTSLAVAAGHTQKVKLASGIAIAAARSPFETAAAAIDMDRISQGRFILGLGSSVEAITSGMFGAPKIKPIAHLKETVAAVRHIVAGAHKGLQPFEGEYYNADFGFLNPQEPPVREEIPIWLAALRGPLVRTAAEIADGIMGHPIWSVEWAVDEIQSYLAEGLRKGGRQREDVELNLWFNCAPNTDEREALEDAKHTVAFYGSAVQYESFFAAHGYQDEARNLQAAVQADPGASRSHLVPDEMARTFVICGKPDYVKQRLEKAWTVADSLCINPPGWGLSQEKIMFYQGEIEKLIS